ncbi:MAG: radical SAM protein [Desulfovibrionaceae bacterium]|nr:radical SAM protein [Desulfovibrionaceae bacterium]
MRLRLRDGSGAAVAGEYLHDCNRLFIDGTEIRPGPATPRDAPRMLRVAVGKRCNFSCAYCHQGPWKQAEEKRGRPADIAAFCRREQDAGRPFASIQIWGGEPFVYFDAMRDLLRALHRNGVAGFSYDVTTNGSLLHGERLDWVLAHPEIHINISWDGPGQFLRGKDVLRDATTARSLRTLFDARPDTAIAPVISRHVDGAADVLREAAALLERKNVPMLDPALLVACDPASRAQGKSPDELRRYARDTAILLLKRELPPTLGYYRNARLLGALFGSRLLTPEHDTMCFVGSRSTLTIDLEGNILTCQNFNADSVDCSGDRHCRGNIFTGEYAPPEFSRLRARRQGRCARCLLLQFCKGGCPYGEPAYEEYNCAVTFHQLLPLFLLAVFDRTGLIVQEIAPDA